MARNRRRKKDWVPGFIIAWVLLAFSGVFILLLSRTKLLPSRYMGILLGVLLGLILIDWILLFRTTARGRFTVGLLLSFLLLIALVLGSLYCYKTGNAFTTLTKAKPTTSRVGVFVLADDGAQSVSDTDEYPYGILETMDREHTDQALPQLTVEYGFVPEVTEYASLTDLAAGLRRGEVKAMVINQGYVELLREMEGYEDFPDLVRLLGYVDLVQEAQEEPQEAETAPSAFWGQNVYTLYISGVDADGDPAAAGRSDVNIVATVNLNTKQMLLVSTPRDYFIPLSISGGARDKLTHAGIYGVQVSMDTLSMLYDIDLRYFVRMNFAGFEGIIDALGGITVWSDYEFDSQNILGYHFVQGENYVNGEQALVFSRERFAFEDGDNQRGKNQMAVIRGVLAKATSLDMLTNFGSVLTSLSDCVATNIPYGEIANILRGEITRASAWNVVTFSVSGTGDTQVPYSMNQPAYVMIPDEASVEMAKELMRKVRAGESIEQ